MDDHIHIPISIFNCMTFFKNKIEQGDSILKSRSAGHTIKQTSLKFYILGPGLHEFTYCTILVPNIETLMKFPLKVLVIIFIDFKH